MLYRETSDREIIDIFRNISLPFDRWSTNYFDLIKLRKEIMGTPINESFEQYKKEIKHVIQIFEKYQETPLHEKTPIELEARLLSIKKSINDLKSNFFALETGCEECLDVGDRLEECIKESNNIIKQSKAIGENELYKVYTSILTDDYRKQYQDQLMLSLGIKGLDRKLEQDYQ